METITTCYIISVCIVSWFMMFEEYRVWTQVTKHDGNTFIIISFFKILFSIPGSICVGILWPLIACMILLQYIIIEFICFCGLGWLIGIYEDDIYFIKSQ